MAITLMSKYRGVGESPVALLSDSYFTYQVFGNFAGSQLIVEVNNSLDPLTWVTISTHSGVGSGTNSDPWRYIRATVTTYAGGNELSVIVNSEAGNDIHLLVGHGNYPLFDFNYGSSEAVEKSTGVVTFTRASPQTQIDYQGVLKNFGVNERAVANGSLGTSQPLTNTIADSNNFVTSGTAWSQFAGGFPVTTLGGATKGLDDLNTGFLLTSATDSSSALQTRAGDNLPVGIKWTAFIVFAEVPHNVPGAFTRLSVVNIQQASAAGLVDFEFINGIPQDTLGSANAGRYTKLGNGWWSLEVEYTTTGVATDDYDLRMFPDRSGGGGMIYLWHVGTVQTDFSQPLIISSGGPATRAVQNMKVDNPESINNDFYGVLDYQTIRAYSEDVGMPQETLLRWGGATQDFFHLTLENLTGEFNFIIDRGGVSNQITITKLFARGEAFRIIFSKTSNGGLMLKITGETIGILAEEKHPGTTVSSDSIFLYSTDGVNEPFSGLIHKFSLNKGRLPVDAVEAFSLIGNPFPPLLTG